MWKFTADRPVYIQIIDIIMSRIASGEYKPGERIPSVRELALEAQVNPNTMQRALSEIERNGYIISLRTSGKFVTDDVNVINNLKKHQTEELVSRFAEELQKRNIPISEAIGILSQYIQ